MKKLLTYTAFAILSVALIVASCKKDDDDKDDDTKTEDPTGNDPTTEDKTDISVLESKFYGSGLTWSTGDEYITISTDDQPDHKSMYYAQSNSLYEAYDEPENKDFKKNPNSIKAQNYTLKIPRYPEMASTHQATAMDAFGVAVNGVVFFNQEAAPGDDILEELNTFDQYEGHPQQQGAYHYHIEPIWLTETKGDDALMGVLLDGFPVYGPVENGVRLTNDDLDVYHGHTSATAEFPDGIYHYHITDDLPWINGGEFYGTPGTKSN
ncbi:MAG: YHYH protein [Flavobacteriales bacterium]